MKKNIEKLMQMAKGENVKQAIFVVLLIREDGTIEVQHSTMTDLWGDDMIIKLLENGKPTVNENEVAKIVEKLRNELNKNPSK